MRKTKKPTHHFPWKHPVAVSFATSAVLFLLVTLLEPRLVGRFLLATLVLVR